MGEDNSIGTKFYTRDKRVITLIRYVHCTSDWPRGRCTHCDKRLLEFNEISGRHCRQDENNVPFFTAIIISNTRW